MNCPNCNTYRKRKCTKCFFKITTVEIYSIDNPNAQMPQHRPNRTKK